MFNLSGDAQLRGLNISRASGDNARVSVSLSVDIDGQSSESAATVLGAEAEVVASSFHFPEAEDAERGARFSGIAAMQSNAQYDSRHELSIAGYDGLRVQRVSKIKLSPTARSRWSISCAILLEEPPVGMLGVLAEMLHESVPLTLTHDRELPLEGGGRSKRGPSQQSMPLSEPRP